MKLGLSAASKGQWTKLSHSNDVSSLSLLRQPLPLKIEIRQLFWQVIRFSKGLAEWNSCYLHFRLKTVPTDFWFNLKWAQMLLLRIDILIFWTRGRPMNEPHSTVQLWQRPCQVQRAKWNRRTWCEYWLCSVATIGQLRQKDVHRQRTLDVRELWGTSLRRNSLALAEASLLVNCVHLRTEELNQSELYLTRYWLLRGTAYWRLTMQGGCLQFPNWNLSKWPNQRRLTDIVSLMRNSNL